MIVTFCDPMFTGGTFTVPGLIVQLLQKEFDDQFQEEEDDDEREDRKNEGKQT